MVSVYAEPDGKTWWLVGPNLHNPNNSLQQPFDSAEVAVERGWASYDVRDWELCVYED